MQPQSRAAAATPVWRSRIEDLDLELGILSSEKREVHDHLQRLQHCLSDSVLQERKAQQRVEKQQMMLHFHKTRAAIVSRQILKVSGELKDQEKHAWEMCQEKRMQREARGRVRAYGSAALAPSTPSRARMSSTSPASWKPAPGLKASSVPASAAASLTELSTPPASSSSTALMIVDPLARVDALAATWDGNFSDTKESSTSRSRGPLSPKPWSKARGTPGSPPSTAGARRDGMLQLGSRLKSTLPSAGESNSTTLLDWFDDKETTWQSEGRPVMQTNQGGLSGGQSDTPLTATERRQEAERQKKLKDEVKAQRRLEADRQKAVEAERKAEDDRRAARRQQAQLRQLTQDRRGAIRESLIRRGGTAEEAFRALDQNGSGRVSLNEFVGGVNSLNVPWEDITGLTKINEVFKLFDHDRKGYLDFAKLFPLDANKEVDPTRLSTPEYWKHFCQNSKDIGPDSHRGPTWDSGDPEQKLKFLEDARNANHEAGVKRQWMRGMIHRLKHKGKGDARCREIVAAHLPRGTGPPDLEDVPTFSYADTQNCKKVYNDKVQESVRNIEKVMFDLHEQRRSLHASKQQLFAITEEPIQRQKALEDSRASLMKLGGFGDLFGKKEHKEEQDQKAE